MKIGFMGLGKLGLPCALYAEDRGHEVKGYDPSPNVAEILETKVLPYREEGAQPLLDKTSIEIIPVKELAEWADIIFVPIQTPHHPMYEGITRIPDTRVDFDYTYLVEGIKQLSEAIDETGDPKIVSIISTVLPGTVNRHIKPIMSKNIRLCYNPFFIAMGTTIPDFRDPEFVLLGVDNEEAAETVEKFYGTLHEKPVYRTTIDNAELIKVAYNTFIGMKIAFVNTLMEICHHTDASVDAVTDALKMADKRIINTTYLSAGMGDGGGCHPRDNIALSWLARELDLKFDWFDSVMMAREKQTEFLAELIAGKKSETDLPVIIMGEAFKPETNLVVGSPAILLGNILSEMGIDAEMYDPQVHPDSEPPCKKAIYFIGTKHDEFKNFQFPHGSVVLDPHRYIPEQDGVVVIGIGK
jgi:UDPglucose 6-dehydrogenase